MPAYKNAAGRWYCAFYYTNWTGKRKKKKKEGFATKREAQAFERSFLEKEAGKPSMSFQSLYDLYKEDCSHHLRKSTMAAKFTAMEKNILPYFSNLGITEITPAIVRTWQNEITSKGYAPGYLYLLHRQLSAIMNFAVRFYGLSVNPVPCAGSIGKNEPRQAFWTLDEFRRFAMTLSSPIHIMVFYLLFWTGARIGEVLALTWDDVGEGSIHISKTMSHIKGETYIRAPKTRESIRTVKLPSFLSAMLEDYRRLSTYTGPNLFPSAGGGSFVKVIARHAKMAGVTPIRIHDLRHSHASMLIHAGVPVIAIAERLGHKNAQTTLQVYAHLYKSAKDEVTSVLEKL